MSFPKDSEKKEMRANMKKNKSKSTFLDEELNKYKEITKRSAILFAEAKKYLPGGSTRELQFFEPYPPFIERGDGCLIFDVEGNSWIDFFNNATSLILGHCHAAVVKAVSEQLQKGTAFHAPSPYTTELAKLLCERISSMEQVRFTNSGSEATLLAIQLAKAFTSRNKIAKFEGGYHGSHEYASISVHPDLALAGDPKEPCGTVDSLGVSKEILNSVIVLPFNDIDAADKIIKKNKDDLAGIIVEPQLGSGGVIPGKREFLFHLWETAKRYQSLLIFDEVQTFRCSHGGIQGLYKISPDLTTLGKIIGGGFPVGAVGGRSDIMHLLDSSSGRAAISHGGTFNGNPITMVAGLATLKELTPEVFSRLNDLGEELRSGLRALFNRFEVPAQITGEASFFRIHLKSEEILNYRSVVTGINKKMQQEMFMYLLNRGIFCTTGLRGALSTPMSRREIHAFLNTVEDYLKKRF